MARIRDIAVTCRSKNASPFLLTLDIVFPDRETFEKVRASGCDKQAAYIHAVQRSG